MSELKTELTKCANVIRHHATYATDNDRTTLSEGLNAFSGKICKLESARNNITSNIANVERSVQDNTVNITNIMDSGTANKTNYKQHKRDLKDGFDSEISKVSDVSVLKTDYNAATKSMGSKLKTIQHSTKHDTADVVEKSLRTFSSEISEKIDKLCLVMTSNFHKLAGEHQCTELYTATSMNSVSENTARSSSAMQAPWRQLYDSNLLQY